MYENDTIYGRGYYSSLFLAKANELSDRYISKADTSSAPYVVGSLGYKDSSRSLLTFVKDSTSWAQTHSQLFAAAGFTIYKFPVGAQQSFQKNVQSPVRKILVNYETFKQFKEKNPAAYNYFKPYNFTGYVNASSHNNNDLLTYSRQIYAFKGEWNEEVNNSEKNYRLNSSYDDYILISGMQFFDDEYNLSSDYKLYGQRLVYTELLANVFKQGLLSSTRELSKFENITGNTQFPPFFFPLNGIVPNLQNNNDGFSFFAPSYTPRGYIPSSNKSYIFGTSPAVDSPFICMSLTTNTVYNNVFYLSEGGESYSAYNARIMSGFILAPSISDFAAYFSDWGLELYTSMDDLFQDKPEEGTDLPDIGYEPPIDLDGIPDNSIDDVTPLLPNISPAVLSKTYCLNFNEYQDFNAWIASTDFLDALSKYFQDPMDGVLSLKLYPFDFLQHDSAYLTEESQISIISQSRDIHCYLFTRQYNFIFNGGSYTYTPYYGDFNDYLASYSLYVPFVGSLNLEPSEVIGKTLRLTYGIDILSGQCQVLIYSSNVLIRTVAGVCGMDIPLTGTSYTQAVRNAVNYAVGLGTSIASAAITGIPTLQFAGMGASTIESMKLAEQKATSQFASRLAGGVGVNAAVEGTKTILQTLPQNQQQAQTKSSPCTALFAPQVPYLSIVLPQPIYPDNRQRLEGYSASMTRTIGSMEGYCKGTPYGDWDILGATVEEINMIKQIIQNGFYI